MSKTYDAIVIGSGHNGLTTACYLAKAGYAVLVLERRDTIGGAVCTETMFKSEAYPEGFRMDVGSSAHFMIHQTPVIQDLELEKYGLEYIEMDPFMSFPVPGEQKVIHFHRSIEQTMASIAQVSEEDARSYKEFIEFWKRINRGVLKTFLVPPTTGNIFSEMARGQIRDGSMFAKGEQVTGLQQIFASYEQVVNRYFKNEHVKTALIWMAAQSGPPPDQSATGPFVGWQAMLHESGGKRPRGGSGMLTQAMAQMLKAHGGEIRSDSPVEQILVSGKRAYGVRVKGGEEYLSRVVISNAHVQTTMLNMVGPEHLEANAFRNVENINVGNGFGMVIRCAVKELPKYTSCPDDPYVHNGLQLLCPDMAYMKRAIGNYYKGLPPEKPAVVAMTFSNIDSTLAPEGAHTLFLWAQWHPYELQNDLEWDRIRVEEAQKIYDVVVDYAPNMKDKLIDWYIQTPLDIERKHGLLKGNVMHVEMTFDQMFMFRPTPELSRYETPIRNLYLSSASCHPGGGVFAAAGHNAAQVVLKALKKKKWF
ncbi:Phytoene dehydrogenase-related protein [Cyclonatronum proteinivorum]|uniref:Pyridine nucleotide-disulfide oxidoreductase domain-containing protein 2 n=1 Tax=Cyclonatronum proteinivorum TaxID=1457365 RepID=A0A345UJI3_9BACT|nr:NAD(P)/FAD-dependent oxidoreductase [Cyclonatronum proteinivorum]AXJ00635.1 Phytoene dehydrogenase-related protein [Cyclonatronum proteinivorum]